MNAKAPYMIRRPNGELVAMQPQYTRQQAFCEAHPLIGLDWSHVEAYVRRCKRAGYRAVKVTQIKAEP